MIYQDKKLNLKYATLLFVAVILVYFIISSVISVIVSSTLAEGEDISKYSSSIWYVILSYGAFPLSFILTIFAFNFKDKKTLNYTFSNNGFNLKFLPLLIILSLAIVFGLSSINGRFIEFLTDKFGYEPPEISLPKKSFWGVTISIISVAVLPSVCEELIFRKIILSSMDSCPVWFSAITGGLLFALFHFNPAQTPYQFIFGCIFVIVVCVTGSVYSSMIMHFINNLTIIIIHYSSWNGVVPIYWAICSTLIVLSCVGLLIYLLIKNKKEKEVSVSNGLFIFLPIALCFVIWLGGFAW